MLYIQSSEILLISGTVTQGSVAFKSMDATLGMND